MSVRQSDPGSSGATPRRPRGRVALAIGLLALLSLAIPVSRWQHAERDGGGEEAPGPAPRADIVALQQELRSRGYRWEAGPTGISDLTPAEFERMLGARVPADEPLVTQTASTGSSAPAGDLPARWDWRDADAVTPARLQGVCGSCWAFAAAGALESLLRIYDARDLDVSEQQALDCNREGYSCDGGWMTGAYRVWHLDGAQLEADLPYRGDDDQPCPTDPPAPATSVRSWTAVAADRESVKRALLVGPVASAMHVYADFQHYTGGVYEHEGRDPINHAVLLVGWDDSLGAWILKNSWGRSWGEAGFAYVAYDACRLGTYVHRIDVPVATPLALHHTALGDTAAADVPLALRVVAGSLHAALDPGSVTAWVDSGAGAFPIALERQGGDAFSGTFEATLPRLRVGTQVRYSLLARDVDGNEVMLPDGDPFEFRIVRQLFQDDLESPGAWGVGAPDDDATAGFWEWGEPEVSYGVLDRPTQPGRDLSPGVHHCFVTGLAAGTEAGANDVDGGATTLLSPVFDLNGLNDATARFHLWFSNQFGAYPWEDAFQVYGSADGGSTWSLLYETRAGAVGWRRISLPLHEFLPLGEHWRLAFVAADRAGDSVVEAAIDRLEILTATPKAHGADPDTPADTLTTRLQLAANPSRGALELRIVAGPVGPTTIGIHDATGRRVRVLWRGELPAGEHALVWDGCDDRGVPLGSGRYWARITTPRATVTRSIVRVR